MYSRSFFMLTFSILIICATNSLLAWWCNWWNGLRCTWRTHCWWLYSGITWLWYVFKFYRFLWGSKYGSPLLLLRTTLTYVSYVNSDVSISITSTLLLLLEVATHFLPTLQRCILLTLYFLVVAATSLCICLSSCPTFFVSNHCPVRVCCPGERIYSIIPVCLFEKWNYELKSDKKSYNAYFINTSQLERP